MSYYDRLYPWCIIRCLPEAQTLVIARFRRRGDAEAHLRVLHRATQNGNYTIIFDWRIDPADTEG